MMLAEERAESAEGRRSGRSSGTPYAMVFVFFRTTSTLLILLLGSVLWSERLVGGR